MQTYEVFLKKAGRDSFTHAGALDAPDDELALMLAREAYGRRSEGDEMWVVAREHICVADRAHLALADRVHKHNDGHLVAERRQQHRDAAAAQEAQDD
ncbi:MAG: ring-1,2-phenylacetyl-CoA epoxidase subunit PaaB [Candidatus Poriferisodalaceae bacterium]|jgi:ring-1,2-phenylacetyl-CoA epoxidase subunit PaaB